MPAIGYSRLTKGLSQGLTGGFSGSGAAPEFIFTVKTDNTGTSSDTSFTIPFSNVGTYNVDIDWGDGNTETNTTAATLTHDYGVGNEGTYTIKLGGTNNTFSHWRFGDGSNDPLKILDIQNWGDLDWTGGTDRAFYNCANLDISATDSPNWSNAVDCGECFENCSTLTNFPDCDLSSAALIDQMFRGCLLLTSVGELTVVAVTSCQTMFYQCALLDFDASGWSISNLTAASSLMLDSGFSQTNYDKLLVAWEGQTHNGSVSLHAGTATYSSGAPATAHAALLAESWTLTDGGAA